VTGRRRRPDKCLGSGREPLHTGLVAQDAATGSLAAGVDSQYRYPVAPIDEPIAKRFDKCRLPYPGCTANADAEGRSLGFGPDGLEQLRTPFPIFRSFAFDEGDPLR
jgi:hypothetical protein